MSDLLEATETHVDSTVDGTTRKFLFLCAYDRAEILRADLKRRQEGRDERKKKLVENLKLAGIEKEQMFAELETFDDQYPEEVTEQDWINFVNSPLNDVTILEASLAKTYPDDAPAIAKKARLTLAEKAKVCGLVVASAQPDGDADPNAPAPTAVYGTPAAESSTGQEMKPA